MNHIRLRKNNLCIENISALKLAKKYDFEVFAESLVCWVGLRYKSDKLDKHDLEKVKEYIPNRLKFFDEMNFNMYPM